MPFWTDLIHAHHRWAHENDGFDLVLNDGATDAAISSLAEALGVNLPPEFCEFYGCHDGFGVRHDKEPDKIFWFLTPIAQIPDLVRTARDWFHETHPLVSQSFIPFIDWGCGDYTGYFIESDGTLLPGLFTFWHEDYEFDADQLWENFIFRSDASILEFLSARQPA